MILLIIGLFFHTSHSAPHILGKDSRIAVKESNKHPFNKIAEIIIVEEHIKSKKNRTSKCTGSLIAPNLVLTNKHCVALADSLYGKQQIYAGFRYNSDTKVVLKAWPKFISENQDVAVLEIESPLHEYFGYFGLILNRNLIRDELVLTAGFPGDRKEMVYELCRIRDGLIQDLKHEETAVGEKLYGVDCDIFAGQSGSPVLTKGLNEKSWYLISVLFGMQNRDGGPPTVYQKYTKRVATLAARFNEIADELRKLILESIKEYDKNNYTEKLENSSKTPFRNPVKKVEKKRAIKEYIISRREGEDSTSPVKFIFRDNKIFVGDTLIAQHIVQDHYLFNMTRLVKVDDPGLIDWLNNFEHALYRSAPYRVKKYRKKVKVFSREEQSNKLTLRPVTE